MKPPNHTTAAQPLSESLTASAISRCSPTLPAQMPLCDRFQGTLLGLWLVSVATVNHSAKDRLTLIEVIAASFEHITCFTASSNSLPQPQSSLDSPLSPAKQSEQAPFWAPFWLASLPKLLRYHDSRERRWQSFSTAELQLDFFLGQTLMLGDLLEFALSGYIASPADCTDCLVQLQKRSQPDGLRSESWRHYQSILTEILARLPEPTAVGVTQSASDHADFINGVLSALTHLESYRLSVQVAARHGGLAPLVAGVLAGAIGGQAALPVIWQMKSVSEIKQERRTSSRLYQGADDKSGKQVENQDDLDSLIDEKAAKIPQRRSEVISLANQLFEQWAGINPAASKPTILADRTDPERAYS